MAGDTAAARIAESLRQQILIGQLTPGTLLSQAPLARSFSVSRIPVRDALQHLAAEGLIRPTSGATAEVTPLSTAELQELYEMREAIEPVATQLALPNVGRAQVLRMRRCLEQMGVTTSARTWLHQNTEFHAALYLQANRPRMIELVERLRKLTDRYLHLHLKVIGNTEHLHEEHTRILQAAERGDAELTATLTRQHLASSHDFILQYLLQHSHADDPDPFTVLHHDAPGPSPRPPVRGQTDDVSPRR